MATCCEGEANTFMQFPVTPETRGMSRTVRNRMANFEASFLGKSVGEDSKYVNGCSNILKVSCNVHGLTGGRAVIQLQRSFASSISWLFREAEPSSFGGEGVCTA